MKEYNFTINGTRYSVSVDSVENGMARVSVNGTPYNVEIGDQMTGPKPVKPVQVAPATHQPTPAPKKIEQPSAPSSASALKSPLPGVILEMKVKEGDEVKEGQCLMILEAMKMENNIDALRAGVVRNIQVAKGDSVLEGDVLLTIE